MSNKLHTSSEFVILMPVAYLLVARVLGRSREYETEIAASRLLKKVASKLNSTQLAAIVSFWP